MSCRNVKVDRPLQDWEKEILHLLMDKGKPEAYRFIPQIDDVSVVAECECGCPRIFFSDEADGDIMILANQVIDRPDGGRSLWYVFAIGESLGGLEGFHYNQFGEREEGIHESIIRKTHLEKWDEVGD